MGRGVGPVKSLASPTEALLAQPIQGAAAEGGLKVPPQLNTTEGRLPFHAAEGPIREQIGADGRHQRLEGGGFPRPEAFRLRPSQADELGMDQQGHQPQNLVIQAQLPGQARAVAAHQVDQSQAATQQGEKAALARVAFQRLQGAMDRRKPQATLRPRHATCRRRQFPGADAEHHPTGDARLQGVLRPGQHQGAVARPGAELATIDQEAFLSEDRQGEDKLGLGMVGAAEG